MRTARRGGFSLLEMMLASAVLLGCAVVLAELAGIGTQHVDDVEGLAGAQVICQTTLNEMLSGAAPVESFEKRPVDEHPGWMVSAEVATLGHPGVASLRVTAWYEEPGQEMLATEPRRQHLFALVRWIRDPYAPTPSDGRPSTLQFRSLMDEIGGGTEP